MNLKGATALITGGTSGIGLAIARMLATRGRASRLPAVTNAARRGRQTMRRAPVSRRRLQRGGRRTDVWRVSSGVWPSRHPGEQRGLRRVQALVDMDRRTSIGVCDQRHRRHAHGAGGRQALHRAEERQHRQHRLDGRVRGAANGTAYYGSKFALRGMTECWRAELRPHNVRVILSIRARS